MTMLQHGLVPSTGGYQIERSLRFNSADSAYLNRTPASAGDRKIFTWSGWVKRSALGATSFTFFSAIDTVTPSSNFIRFTDDSGGDKIRVSIAGSNLQTTAVYRDPSAWYHIVVAVDTTQATASNRIKLYVNGVQVTDFSTSTYPSQNTDSLFNSTSYVNYIGVQGTSNYYNGYLADIHFIDGSALTPSSFGENDTDTGVWKPKAYTGSYGTNGFKLTFSDNSGTTSTTLGKDTSGNGNNWTPNNFSVTAGAGNDSLVDTPTPYGTDTGAGGEVRGNYATFNSLNTKLGAGSLTNGNLTFTGPSGTAAYNFTGGTFEIDTSTTVGWYFEITQSTYGQFAGVSLLDTSFYAGALDTANSIGAAGGNATAGITYRNAGNIYNYGTETTGLTTWSSSGDVIGIAIKNNKIWFAKNGTWISGDPAAGTSPSITLASTKKVTPAATGINSNVFNLNAGQRPFAYTAPSGFKALCTTNLPTPTIGATSSTRAGKYFNTVLYNGNGASNRQITGVGFQPDFVWQKGRGVAYNHYLMDAVRGSGKVVYSNLTNAEGDISAAFKSFDSDGFTITQEAGFEMNNSLYTYVAWNWKANGAGSSNTAGSITSTVSANTTAGFSIVTWTGNATQGATVGHGLGAVPALLIFKNRSVGSTEWPVKTNQLATNAYLYLNASNASASYSFFWSADPTSSLIYLGSDNRTNGSGNSMVCYAFAPVAGYSAFGSYTGNGSADGPFIYTGFRPAFLLIKNTSSARDWAMWDVKRNTYNLVNTYLTPNSNAAESSDNTLAFDAVSNGFKVRGTWVGMNNSGETIIYAAFAENPFKYSLAR